MVSIRGCCFKEFRISRLSQLGFSLLRFSLTFVRYGAWAHSLWTQSANLTADSMLHDEKAGDSRLSRLSGINSALKRWPHGVKVGEEIHFP
jgi:hypothetical protein